MKRLLPCLAASAVLLWSCGGDGHDDDGHGEDGHGEDGHTHQPMYGGTLVELGDHESNVEFVLDAETGTLRMYVLGAHADSAVRTSQETADLSLDVHADEPIEVTLRHVASELSGETVGDSSVYEVQSDELVGVDHFHGTLAAITVKDVDYADVTFDFPAEEEDDHEDGEGDDHEHSDEEGSEED